MNLHGPQSPESESELKNLAAVPHQIISPANNSPIIGIYQDSMLGCYRFTRDGISFSQKDAMNLLMMFKKVNVSLIKNELNDRVTNFEILSQIMPPMSIKVKNKQFDGEKEKASTSNNVVEIIDGKYIRGQMDKGILGSGTKGLIHRICNDFGNMASSDFIDDIQNVVTEFMKQSAFSVGISDLITDEKTNEKIVSIITEKKTEVKDLIDQVKIGVFENNSGKSNLEEFETRVNNVLSRAQNEAGREALKNLSKENRFVVMFNAGSKGSEINIQQMTACLGQQNVDGKRIPYGFEGRTLPHYTKYDDSASARGFVESSYINGLSPQELFFHAMGGRIGLIDTAVKTSTTGYIQRRLIKALEDLMVNYDMTIRTNKNKLVQFSYGDDSIDTIKVENQDLPIVEMSVQDIYSHFAVVQQDDSKSRKVFSSMFTKTAFTRHKKQLEEFKNKCEEYINYMINSRDKIVKNVFNNKSEKVVRVPVAFAYIIQNVIGQQGINQNSLVDITLLDAFKMIEDTFAQLNTIVYAKPTELFKTLYFYYLSPKDLLINKRFNSKALSILLENIKLAYKRAIVAPGEMVGMIAAQSIGEPTTQMSILKCEHIRCGKINKKTGKISMILEKMGDLCDKIIEEHPEYTCNINEHSVETLLDRLDDDYYIIGVDEKEQVHWNKISHVSRHPTNGDLVKVTTKSGRSVTTTLSHSHLIRNEETQTVSPIKGSDLKEGMRIPVAKYIPNKFVNYEILVGKDDIQLDELFGWFIGAYLSEGNINGNQICITNISQHYIDNVKLIAERFEKKCGVSYYAGEYGPGVTTKVNYKELAEFIVRTCGTGSFVKRIPDFAFTAPIEFKKGLLRGYMDGDGNFQCDEKHHQIRSCSRSKQLTSDIALMFSYFGIFAHISTTFTRGSEMHHLSISAKYSKVYQENIGSNVHSVRLMNLVSYLERNNAKNLPDEVDKINGLGEIIASCGKKLALPGQSRTYGRWAKKESIGRRTLEKYIETFEESSNKHLIEEELIILKQAANSGVVWDEIVNIEIIPGDEEEFVYDFTVPANQTFMVDSGIIVHNTLNTFHFAGVASKSNVTRGVPRIEEILALSGSIKNPSLTIYLKEEDQTDKDKANSIQYMIEHTKLSEIVIKTSVYFDPDDLNTLIEDDKVTMSMYRDFENMLDECAGQETVEQEEKSKWVIRMELDPEVMLEKNITMDDVNFTLNNVYKDEINCVYSDYNSDKLIFRIRMNNVLKSSSNKSKKNKQLMPLDQSDQIYILNNFQEQLLDGIVLRGVKNISKVIIRKVKDNLVEKAGSYVKEDIWVLDTIGTNLLQVLGLDYIDAKRTVSNDIVEVFNVLGMEAARQCIYNEISEVLEFDSAYVNTHHMALLCDRMTFSHKMISIFRHGINNDDIGPVAKASFEETPEMFLKAARHAELDTMRGVSANVMCGQEGMYGTAAFQVVLDINEMIKMDEQRKYEFMDEDKMIEEGLMGEVDGDGSSCGKDTLTMHTNVANVHVVDLGDDNDYDPFA